MNLKIVGTGSSVPKEVVTNEFITNLVDTTDEFIVSRTGIKERHVATNETTVSMAVDASKKALEKAGVSAEELDLIIVRRHGPRPRQCHQIIVVLIPLVPCKMNWVQKELLHLI